MEFTKVLEHYNNRHRLVFDQTIDISILRNHTVENLTPYLTYELNKLGIDPVVNIGDYNNMVQESMSADSKVLSSSPRIVVLSLTVHEYLNPDNPYQINTESIRNEIDLLIENLISKTNAILVLNTFDLPLYEENGIVNSDSSFTRELMEINKSISEACLANPSRVFKVDFNRIIAELGEERAIDYRFGYSARQFYKNEFFEKYAFEVSKIVRALLAKSKKCLVLDCDNTLWKGIVGEDGADGIKMSSSSYPGNIFHAFQASVIQLYQRGVIITLCSKNNEQDVFDVLKSHPDCLIRDNHLAAWRVNWNNKAQNIVELAEELNIGLDSFVFVDDNPVECDLIRDRLPMVEVIQVPTKLYNYPNILLRGGYFDTLTISEEDKKRNDLYRAESQRKGSAKNYSDVSDYLASLGIVLTIGHNQLSSLPRLAQLTQKTNQFNLTTKRYSEEEMKFFVQDEHNGVIQFSVADKYGDMGLTGMLIYRVENTSIFIDSFLLSCRILGRNIELAFVQYCISYFIKLYSATRIIAEFIRTKKNGQTEDFWEKNGFLIDQRDETSKRYALRTEDFKPVSYDYIKIETIQN